MENTLRSAHHPKFLTMPTVLAVIYAFGVPVFISLWLGKQAVPGFSGLESYGLAYALLCLLGTVANVAILRGYRLGVVGQLSMWVANWVLNVVLGREGEPSLGWALLLVALWIFEVNRNRESLS